MEDHKEAELVSMHTVYYKVLFSLLQQERPER